MRNIYSLHLKVTLQRQRLADLVDRYGRQDPRVLAQSKRLDELIVQLQRRMAG